MSSQYSGITTGISVIAHAGDPANADQVFRSYMQQDVKQKELILVHNGSLEEFDQWLQLSRLYPMVRLYRQSPATTIGECLNYCIERSIFEYIAFFDEQASYAANYLSGSISELCQHPSCLTGKNPGYEHCYTDEVPLATFVFPRALFAAIRFPSSNTGLDTLYCQDCRSRSGKIYSSGSSGFSFPPETIPSAQSTMADSPPSED